MHQIWYCKQTDQHNLCFSPRSRVFNNSWSWVSFTNLLALHTLPPVSAPRAVHSGWQEPTLPFATAWHPAWLLFRTTCVMSQNVQGFQRSGASCQATGGRYHILTGRRAASVQVPLVISSSPATNLTDSPLRDLKRWTSEGKKMWWHTRKSRDISDSKRCTRQCGRGRVLKLKQRLNGAVGSH